MISIRTRPGRFLPGLLAWLIVCLVPTFAPGDTITFRNDCRVALVVQAVSVQRGVLKRDQMLLKAGETTPRMALDSDKVISVYDGKTGRILFRESLKASKTALNYGIVPDPRFPNRVRMQSRPAMTDRPASR